MRLEEAVRNASANCHMDSGAEGLGHHYALVTIRGLEKRG